MAMAMQTPSGEARVHRGTATIWDLWLLCVPGLAWPCPSANCLHARLLEAACLGGVDPWTGQQPLNPQAASPSGPAAQHRLPPAEATLDRCWGQAQTTLRSRKGHPRAAEAPLHDEGLHGALGGLGA
jgi:hypothetical protein